MGPLQIEAANDIDDEIEEIQMVEVDVSKLTAISHEVISKQVRVVALKSCIRSQYNSLF